MKSMTAKTKQSSKKAADKPKDGTTAPNKGGRPSKYNTEIAEKICSLIASGMSLRKICAKDGMPDVTTVILWSIQDREGFSQQYANARRHQAELLADELFDIADDSTNDYMIRQSNSGESHEVSNPEVVARSRLRVDTRKWYLSKVLPKVYGDKILQEITGKDGGPIEIIERVIRRPSAK